jgi:hypothetical protein
MKEAFEVAIVGAGPPVYQRHANWLTMVFVPLFLKEGSFPVQRIFPEVFSMVGISNGLFRILRIENARWNEILSNPESGI